MRYILSVSGSGPLSIRARREMAGSETQNFIPGVTVLGALGAAHAALCDDQAQFNAFFGPASRFGNLYPASFEKEDLSEDVDAPVYPLPLTALSCKRFSGFHFDQPSADDPHHGVQDTLIASTVYALSKGRQPSLVTRFDHCTDASGCGEPMDRFDGYYRRSTRTAQKVGSAQVRRGVRTRTGISRLTGAAERGILYSREVLNAGTAYWGVASVPDEHAAAFADFVKKVSTAGLLRFGNNRTRGFGRVRIEVRKDRTADTVQTLLERLKIFDQQVRALASANKVMANHDLYAPITLTSDAILMDHLLRCKPAPDGAYLEREYGIAGAELVFQSSGVRRVMGWNSALGVPKADDTAATMGSVFVYGLSRPLDRAMVEKFLAIQEKGIGVRRREGFGQLIVASPFHYEVKGL